MLENLNEKNGYNEYDRMKNSSLKDLYILILKPVNVTLYGKVFVDVIKNLEMGDYPRLSGWALNAITCILIRWRQREISHTHT